MISCIVHVLGHMCNAQTYNHFIMKKFRYLLAFFILMPCVFSFAQYSPSPVPLEKAKQIDNSTCELQYTLRFKKNYKQKEYNIDDRIVQVGSHIVKDYSKIIYYFDSLSTENNRKGKDTPGNPNTVYCYELYNDLSRKTCSIKYRMPLNGGTLCYTAKLPFLDWTLVPDSTKEILGYACNMAKTQFAGREYVAWYAVDIPLPYGPYKFYGLPGLVLQIEDVTKLYIWELKGIRNAVHPINLYTYEAEQRSTEQDALKTIDRIEKRPIRFLEQMGRHMYVKGSDGRLRPSTSIQNIPDQEYEPLEKY